MKQLFVENLNHGRFETWAQKPEMDFLQVTQTHSVDIVSQVSLPCEADGIKSEWKEFKLPLVIKTADCMPIVIEGQNGIVFLHAGWKGLADGILKQPEVKEVKPQRVFIGPSIHSCCFEVTSEFKNHFPDSKNFEMRNAKMYFNLQQEAKDELSKNFPELTINVSLVCTCCNLEFNSYRRDKTKNRNWNIYIKG